MTIQEAMRSGKPFRRKGWPPEDIWIAPDDHWDLVFMDNHDAERFDRDELKQGEEIGQVDVTPADILADDWELKEAE